jgi:heme-degrading monooxygenase HmoA
VENYVVTFTAQPGKEDIVADYYLGMQPDYEAAPGFIGRQIYRAKPGTMVEALKKIMTPEQMAAHPEPEHDGSVHFVVIEQWESIDDRIAFGQSVDKSRQAGLFPNLKPAHTHEYYDQIG